MKVAIIGAGAAGCFCAVNLKRRIPDAEVVVYESGSKALAKVAITGGGRCNLTNSFDGVRSIESVYPRGGRQMKRWLREFSHQDTIRWFEKEGVRLMIQPDGCVFPVSQDAMEIVHTLLRLMQQLGVELRLNHRVTNIAELRSQYNYVVVTTGGSPRQSGLTFLSSLNLNIVPPVPSLFTFSVDDTGLHSLMGTVVDPVTTRLCGTKIQTEGALLITHWGLSGPAILKLSSRGARYLADNDYQVYVSINWLYDRNEKEVLEMLQIIKTDNLQKQIGSFAPLSTLRHWQYLLHKAELLPSKRWSEVGTRQMNRLSSLLTNDVYFISGRGTYKDEFVTCGGVSLSDINISTLECKSAPGVYFAGEVLDLDALTGGFNLQAAWTTGYIISQKI